MTKTKDLSEFIVNTRRENTSLHKMYYDGEQT